MASAALSTDPSALQVVVFNTKERGTWGKEERGHDFPFQRGQPFEVLLISTKEGFKVSLCHRRGLHEPGHSCHWRPARPWWRWGAKAWPRLGSCPQSLSLSWRNPSGVRGQVCAGQRQSE